MANKRGTMRARGAWVLALTPLLLAPIVRAHAQAAQGAGEAPLRLCADPTNPPFSSSAAGEPGIYLEIGGAVAKSLGRTAEPVWQVTFYGKRSIRETLLAGKCDMFVGVPADADFMGNALIRTQPILSAGFALVTHKSQPVEKLSGLRGRTVAVQIDTPPQSLLAQHDDITMSSVLDPEAALQALQDGKVDAAFVWGQSAGYLNHTKLHDAYLVTPISGWGMQYQVAIGFARKQVALRDQVNSVLPSLRKVISDLAAKYGFPQGAAVNLSFAAPATPPVQYADFLVGGDNSTVPLLQIADAISTDDDQKSAADFVAPNREPADINFAPDPAPTAAAEGRTIFNGTCNHCHGPDAIQSVRKINLRLLQHRYGGLMDQVFHYTVTHGRTAKGMPNWTGVFTEPDFAKILAFLQTVQEDTKPEN